MTSNGGLPSFTFYNYWRSSASYRVRIALNLKGIVPARTVDVDIRTGEQKAAPFDAVMPHGLVPAFAWADGTLTQSLAMIEWIDQLEQGLKLVPADPYAAARAREIALAVACDIHPLNNLRVLNYLVNEFKTSESERARWYRHWIVEGLTAIEQIVIRERRKAPFAFGEHPGLAEICLVPQLFNARRFEVDLSSFPTLVEVDRHCAELEAFVKAAPGAPA